MTAQPTYQELQARLQTVKQQRDDLYYALIECVDDSEDVLQTERPIWENIRPKRISGREELIRRARAAIAATEQDIVLNPTSLETMRTISLDLSW